MAHFDVNKIKIRFIIKYPRFKYILNDISIIMDTKINTACTDGEKLYFNPEFMETLDEEQQLFVFAHEVLHIALNHIDRCLDKDPYYWNIATDAVINDYLKSNGLKPIDGGIDIADALNHTAEELYEKLKKEDEKKKNNEPQNTKNDDKKGNGKQTNSNSNSNNDKKENNKDDQKNNDSNSNNNDKENNKENKNKNNVGHDSHEMWQDAAKKRKAAGKDNKQAVKENDEFVNNDKEKERNDNDYLTTGGTPKDNNIHGNGKGSGRKNPNNLIDEPSTLDWRTLLIQNTVKNPDWDTRTGEVENGVVVPTFVEDEFSECEILIDTSGSISEDLIKNFLNECLSLIKTSKTKVGFFDTEFYGFNDIRDEDDINDLNIDGGGGTDFNVAVEAFSENCNNKIIFTDGCSSMPNKEIDAIWIVFGYFKTEIHPKGGKVIYITGEDYNQLCNRKKSKSR